MAVTDAVLASDEIGGISKSILTNKLLLVIGIAAVVAVMAGTWLWSQQPDYRVLFANYQDKDGGAIVGALEQMNIPYKFSDGGGAILVPASQVHQARLKLASQGLPKGGNIGFEILEAQKFGVSQFVEQVNFQRALEGELERTIQSISAVESARIHLAIPKSSVFVRDQQKPTASVMLHMHAGRTLDQQQVSAVVHLVASSIPELTTSNVTVVDQNGNLLSDTQKKTDGSTLDPSQLKYVDDLQQNIIRRVESIIAPMVGAKNVHAEASAEVDFSTVEQANESYKPNQKPDDITIRSQQTSEAQSATNTSATGVPGALSNQPPVPAAAPITAAPSAAGVGATAAPSAATPSNSQKNSTTNFEVDKTVRYLQQSMGGIKRLTVAVVVNYKEVVGKGGKVTNLPLTEAEKKQISDLAKQAMGFSEPRGDSLTVVNSAFAVGETEVVPALPMWKQPDNIEMAKLALRYLFGIVILVVLYRKLMKPMMIRLISEQKAPEQLTNKAGEQIVEGQHLSGAEKLQSGSSYQNNLDSAKQLAKDNPKMVANIVTGWVTGND